jgi:hypothetical protein
MNILKVKIPVGSDGSVKKKFLANPSGEKGVGCADGCIKIVLDDNMMDQIRSFKASPNHLNHDIIPVDIIPGKTDPYLIVNELGDIFWVGGVDPTKLWTPDRNTKGQYKEIKRKDGTIKSYKLDEHLATRAPSDSDSEINAHVVTIEQKWVPYPLVPSTNISDTYKYPTSQKAGKSKRRRTRRFKKKRKKKQTKKRKKKRRTKKRYKRRKKKSVRKRGKKKN